MCYTILQNKKTPFKARKTRTPSVQKIKFFQKSQPMVLIQKCLFFHELFQKKQVKKMCFTIIQEKKPFQAIKTRHSKSRKIDIFPFFHFSMVLVQKWPFFQLFFFLDIIGRENVFYDILERKTPFQAIKKKNLNKSKN